MITRVTRAIGPGGVVARGVNSVQKSARLLLHVAQRSTGEKLKKIAQAVITYPPTHTHTNTNTCHSRTQHKQTHSHKKEHSTPGPTPGGVLKGQILERHISYRRLLVAEGIGEGSGDRGRDERVLLHSQSLTQSLN